LGESGRGGYRQKHRASKDVDVALTGGACLLTAFCLFSFYTWLWRRRREQNKKGRNGKVTWNRVGRKAYMHKLRYELISVGKKEGALSVPRRKTGFMQKRSCGFFWTCRDVPSHRYQWKL
jgi:hypothetical protein